MVEEPEALQKIATSIDGYTVQHRIDYWMNRFFKFDKGTYSTRSKHLQHEWYMTQVEVCSNIVFKSARFCTGKRRLRTSLNGFWINFPASDCPTALLRSLTNDLIVPDPSASGGCTTTTPV